MEMLIEKDIPVRARDGVPLATDVYRPASGGPVPALVARTPYNKDALIGVLNSLDLFRAVRAGYAVVVQDARGRFGSGGEFVPHLQEVADGADALAWVAAQPWSNGAIGTFGRSYLGSAQWLAAATAPPALRALAPAVTPADYWGGLAYRGGAFELGSALYWCVARAAEEQRRRLAAGRATPADVAASARAAGDLGTLYRRTPLTDMPPLRGLAPHYFEWHEHPSYDPYWRAIAPREHYARVAAPALHIGGWYDVFLAGTLANYRGMRERGGSDSARAHGRLIIGPWSHTNWTGIFPERDYGPAASADAADLTGAQLRWFDRWVKGEANGAEGDKPIRLFVMGTDAWRDEDDWPLPDTDYRPFYLHSGGVANGAAGDGGLSRETPGDEPADAFLYDPRRPVPTVGGAILVREADAAGPRDQRPIEGRDDVLCYTSAPLTRPLEVIGPIALTLWASSSAPDTDFTGKLIDVGPDGRAELLTDGILRARYRDSPTDPSPLQPGRPYELRLDLVATANVFLPGHRIRLEVSSSNFPRFDRNSNTGGPVAATAEDAFVPAINRVHHDRERPSRLVLPIIARG